VLSREDVLSLVPHAGAMCLWDQVLAWDEHGIALAARNHCDPAHPLRSEGRLSAVHLCEYGAQAMAVHGGLLARARGLPVRPGMLVSLRGVALHRDRIDDLGGGLRCEASCLSAGQDSQQYEFRITHGDCRLAEGRAAVMLQPSTEDPR